jgi:hypothetical protein
MWACSFRHFEVFVKDEPSSTVSQAVLTKSSVAGVRQLIASQAPPVRV